jgi:hypothetical protein
VPILLTGVWVALMRALIDEVAQSVPKSVLRRMETQHRQFLRNLEELIAMGRGDEMLAERVKKSRRSPARTSTSSPHPPG